MHNALPPSLPSAYIAARAIIREGNVDELIQSAGSQQRGVDDVGPVGGADDEHLSHTCVNLFVFVEFKPMKSSGHSYRLLAVHAVHLGQQLVQHAVRGTAGVAAAATTLHGDGVELIEEEDTRGAAAGLVKDLTHIGLRVRRGSVMERKCNGGEGGEWEQAEY